jgi:metal-responsive CopG/Arc/MetJ family transcriptional regulator
MAFEINRLVTDSNIRSRSQAVMNAVTAVVLHERHVNAYADVHGITINHIAKASEKGADFAYYRATLDFAAQSGWDEFLDAYAQ